MGRSIYDIFLLSNRCQIFYSVHHRPHWLSNLINQNHFGNLFLLPLITLLYSSHLSYTYPEPAQILKPSTLIQKISRLFKNYPNRVYYLTIVTLTVILVKVINQKSLNLRVALNFYKKWIALWVQISTVFNPFCISIRHLFW